MTTPSTLRQLRRRPPDATLDWVIEQVAPGGRLGRVRALTRATARAVHTVEVVSPTGQTRRVVLRRFVPTPESLLDPDMNVEREVHVLQLLADSDVPAPRVLAADPAAASTDVPAILQELLAGQPPRGVPDVRQLLASLARVQSIDAATARLPTFRRWNDPATTDIPPWTADPSLWRTAIEIARLPPTDRRSTVIHGDFHADNTLWLRGRLTGIVDWTTASIGPPAIDLAHLRRNLAIRARP